MPPEPGSAPDAVSRGDLLAEVREVVAREVRPSVLSHLGDIEVVGIDDDGTVHIGFSGACTSCSYRRMTLLGGVFPRIADIEGVNDIRCDGVPFSDAARDRMLAFNRPRESSTIPVDAVSAPSVHRRRQ